MSDVILSNRLLVCPPRFYELKPLKQQGFQIRNKSVNRQLANQQWIDLIRILSENGYQVEKMAPQKKQNVQCLVSELGFQLDGCFILANHLEDNREKDFFTSQDYFRGNGYQTITIPYFFSGAIDMVYSHGRSQLWIGYDQTTSLRGAHYLAELLSSPSLIVKYLQLVDPQYPNISSCVSPFGDGYLLVYPPALAPASYAMLVSSFGQQQVINVTQKEAEALVCCSIMINDITKKTKGLFLASKISPRLKTTFARLGYGFREVPMSEFLIKGSSVKSLILELE